MPPLRVMITDAAPEITHGVLQMIDLIDREVVVRQQCDPVRYLISGNCEVLLNGERVKLRMLQPADRVRVAFCRRGDVRVALSLEAISRHGPLQAGASEGDASVS